MNRSDLQIIYYDGECLLCSRFIRFLKKRKNYKSFEVTTIIHLPQTIINNSVIIQDKWPDSLVYFKNSAYFVYSDAVIEILSDLGGIWKLSGILKLIPKIIRDSMYKVIAKNRYRLFGKTNSCQLPESD